MQDQGKNLLIGVFVLAAVAIVVFILLFLHPYTGDEGQVLHVRFTDIDKVNVGTRVLFAGKPVGEVVKITENSAALDRRVSLKGDVYIFELTLAIDSGIKVFSSDQIYLQTAGLLGEKSVAIDPQPAKPGQELHLITKDEIVYAEQIGTVEQTFNEIKTLAAKFDVLLDTIQNVFGELKDRKMWENIANTAENLSEFTGNLVDSWKEIEESINNIAKTSANTRDISDKVVMGEGTIGKLFVKDDMYLRLTSLLSKGETVFDDINHYGLLFQNDKGWQRLRARRLNLMNQLSTPQEFRNFFNDELNQIQTSLSRVSQVMEKSAECTISNNMNQCLSENPEFNKVFSELLRKVGVLEESIKLYNNEIIKHEVKKTELH